MDGARSVSIAFLAITPTNTFTLEWSDNAALWWSNVKGWKSLTLYWRLFLEWGNDKQPLYTQSLYATNRILIIDIRYCVSNYVRLDPEAFWPLDFWSISLHVMWLRDDVALSHSCTFSRQLMACRSFHQLLINIARLPHLSSSSSFSSISVMYHKQLSTIWTMCTRSVRRDMQLDNRIHTAWQSSCRQIGIKHWPLLLWLV